MKRNPITSMRLYSFQRLRKTKEFEGVRNASNNLYLEPFSIRLRIKHSTPNLKRIGIVASKKVGKAVKRNKGKRLIREIFRTQQAILPNCCDVVIYLRKSFDKFSFQELSTLFEEGIMTTEKKYKKRHA